MQAWSARHLTKLVEANLSWFVARRRFESWYRLIDDLLRRWRRGRRDREFFSYPLFQGWPENTSADSVSSAQSEWMMKGCGWAGQSPGFFFFFFFWAIKVERRGLLMSWSISSILFLSPPPSLLPSQSDVMMKLKEIKGCWDGNGMFVFVLSLLIRLRNWPNTIWTDLFYPQAPRFINFGAIHAVERME